MGIQYRPVDVRFNTKSQNIVRIIDCGADNSIISERLARDLGIDTAIVDDTVDTYTVTMEKKVLKAIYVRLTEKWYEKEAYIKVGITDEFFDPSEYGHGVHVILGVDFLQETDYRPEFTNR